MQWAIVITAFLASAFSKAVGEQIVVLLSLSSASGTNSFAASIPLALWGGQSQKTGIVLLTHCMEQERVEDRHFILINPCGY